MLMGVVEHAGESGEASWWEWQSMLVKLAEHAGESGRACW